MVSLSILVILIGLVLIVLDTHIPLAIMLGAAGVLVWSLTMWSGIYGKKRD